MAFEFANKATTFLVSNLSSAATVVVVGSGEGDKFPSPTGDDLSPLMLEDRLTGAFEIVYMVGRTGDTLSLTRAQEGTASASWPEGTNLSLRATAAVYQSFVAEGGDLQSQIDALSLRLDATDATAEQRKLPIGTIIGTSDNTNPGTSLGYGSWEQYAEGRTLVGVGNNGQATWSAFEQRGNETHALSTDELPIHAHPITLPADELTTDEGGNHRHSIPGQQLFGGGSAIANTLPETDPSDGYRGNSFVGYDGDHSHTFTLPSIPFDSSSVGADEAHNNVQPSLGVYYWRRTA